MKPAPPTAPGDPSRAPILMTLMYPGIGQLLQERWLAAAICLISFTAAFGLLVADVVRVGFVYFSFLNDINTAAPPTTPIKRMVITLITGILVYMGALIDVLIAHRRLRSAHNRRNHPDIPV
jgi:hypothetical protein